MLIKSAISSQRLHVLDRIRLNLNQYLRKCRAKPSTYGKAIVKHGNFDLFSNACAITENEIASYRDLILSYSDEHCWFIRLCLRKKSLLDNNMTVRCPNGVGTRARLILAFGDDLVDKHDNICNFNDQNVVSMLKTRVGF